LDRHEIFLLTEAAGVIIVVSLWSQIGTMATNLSIKNAPDDVVSRLRERARRHHRSLQGELLAIIEDAARESRPSTPAEVLAEVRRLGLRTPSEAASIVRASRDRR
jgi:plasmid stability protein